MKYQLTLHPVASAWHGERLTLIVHGERIVDVDYRPAVGDGAYARQLVQGGMEGALSAVSRVCPYCRVAHTVALSLAIEQLVGVTPPLRAQAIRVVLAELERAASHINTLAALAMALGLNDAARLSRVETRLRSMLVSLAGNSKTAYIRPGGLADPPADLTLSEIAQTVNELLPKMIAVAEQSIPRRSLLARTVDIGTLHTTAARQFGLAGPLARASGVETDLRIHAPYAAYHVLTPELVVEEGGDVHARAVVLLLEAIESLRLVSRWLQNLPVGAVYEEVALQAGEAIVTVEAPRGPLRYTVCSDGRQLTEVQIGIGPQLDRLLARTLLQQAAIDDALLIAISTDPCTTCWQAATYLIGRS